MYDLKINFEQKDLIPVVIERIASEQSLLEAILNNGVELHHNCGAVCACSTCHVYVESGSEYIEGLTDKEEDFIDRAITPKLNSRLACQCILQKGSGNIEITIPDQSQFLGE